MVDLFYNRKVEVNLSENKEEVVEGEKVNEEVNDENDDKWKA